MVRDYRGHEDANLAAIVEDDKVDIEQSSHVLVNAAQCSAGTMMEVLYAWERGKTVITIVPKDARVSPWLQYHSTQIVRSLTEGILWLNGYWWKGRYAVSHGS